MERRVKFFEHLVARQFVIGDLVEFGLDIGSKVVVHDLFEVVTEESGDQFAGWCRNELAPVGAGLFLLDVTIDRAIDQRQDDDVAWHAFALAFFGVAAGLDGVDDRRIGGRPADTEFLELLDEASLGVAGWWPCEDLAGFNAVEIKAVLCLQVRQDLFLRRPVDAQEPVKDDDLAFGLEDLVAGGHGNRHSGVLQLGGCHLAGQGAAADEIIELLVVLVAADGLAGDVGRTDGFVSFLGAGGFGLELADVRVFMPVEPGDKLLGAGDSLAGQVDAVGTHVGDLTVLIKLLGGGHGRTRAEAEFGVGFLLERTGGERCRRVAGARRFLDFGDAERRVLEAFQEYLGLFLCIEALIEFGFDFFAFVWKDSDDLELAGAFESLDLSLAFDE